MRRRGYDRLLTEGRFIAMAVPLKSGDEIVASLGLFRPLSAGESMDTCSDATVCSSEAVLRESLQTAAQRISDIYTLRNIRGDVSA